MQSQVLSVHKSQPKKEEELHLPPSTAVLRSSKAFLPGEHSCQQAASCRILDLLEGRRGTSSLLLNLDNSKVKTFPLLLFCQAHALLSVVRKDFG